MGLHYPNLWALSGYSLYYGTYYLGVANWDPNFGNYPYTCVSTLSGVGFRA